MQAQQLKCLGIMLGKWTTRNSEAAVSSNLSLGVIVAIFRHLHNPAKFLARR